MRAVHRLLTIAGALLLLTGIIAGVVNREVLDPHRFSAHVDAIRVDPAVSRELGAVITDRLLEAQPDLTAIRPLLEATAASVVASPALGATVRSAGVGPVYRGLTHGGQDSIVLRLADVAAVVLGVVAVAAPEQRVALPAELDVRLSRFGGRGVPGEPVTWVHLVGLLAWLLPLLALLLLAGAGATVGAEGHGWRDRLTGAAGTVGRGALGAGVTLSVLLVVTGFVVGRSATSTLTGALRSAVWGQLDGAFWAAAGVVAASGYLLLLLARPGVGLRGDLSLTERVARAWRLTLDPGPGLEARIVRAGFVILAGVALTLQPLEVVRALLWGIGLVLLVIGVALVAQIVVGAVRAGVVRRHVGALLPDDLRVTHVAAVGALVVLVASFVIGGRPSDHDLTAALGQDTTTCNGYDALCARPYDDVAFPATHNAMSAANEPGWFFAEQPDGIVPQLDHGIRALLIDTWYGQRTNRPGIIANTDHSRAESLAEARASFGEDALRSALRVRDALNLTPRGPVEPYLCHALCEIGSTPWLPLMRQVHTWLDAHPREVVTFFIQDTVSPADTAKVFDRAGLLPEVYMPTAADAAAQRWPTLGQMVDSGQRVVVLMENHGGGTAYPWLLDGFRWAQDTPFLFRKPAELSCAANRGTPSSSLFLLNHWITDKSREVSNATLVNARGVLLPRAEQCRDERGRQPNFVAVDFYDRGDLFGVVDTLNGVG